MVRPKRNYTPVQPASEVISDEMLQDGVLDLDSAATFCSHGVTWIKERIRAGELPSFTLKKKRVVPKRVLVAYLATHVAKAL